MGAPFLVVLLVLVRLGSISSAVVFDAEATIQITATSLEVAIDPFRFGFNDVLGPIVNLTFNDLSLKTAVQKMNIQSMRHPGGTVANYWDWKNGQYLNCTHCTRFDKKWAERVAALPPHTFSAANWTAGIGGQQLKGTIYDMNVLTFGQQEAMDSLTYMSRAGVDIQALEMGNEFYLSKHYAWKFPDSKSYIEYILPIMAKARELWPRVQIAVVAHAKPEWDNGLVPHKDKFDAVTQHSYSCSENDIKHLPFDQQLGYVMAFSEAEADRIHQALSQSFGNKGIWQTEFNWALKNEVFGDKYYHGTLHGAFHLSRILKVHEFQYWRVLFLHAFSTQEGGGWSSKNGVVELPGEANDPQGVRASGGAQLFAHISWISRRSTYRGTTITGCPEMPTKVQNKNLLCLQVGLFQAEKEVHYVVINRCGMKHPVTFDTLQVTKPWLVHKISYNGSDVGGLAEFPADPSVFPWPGPLKPAVHVTHHDTQVNLWMDGHSVMFVNITTGPTTKQGRTNAE